MGHLFNSLGCFLLDLLPYRNKSDSLFYSLLFRVLISLIKLFNSPKRIYNPFTLSKRDILN